MTDEQINIAIAEACGIAGEDKWGSLYHTYHGYVRDCPDYCTDLNAMHEAEKTLLQNDALLWHKYATYLDENYINQPYTIGATARQRAEAFLRTLDLWKE